MDEPRGNPTSWRLSKKLRRKIRAFADQTRRSEVASAEVLLDRALRSAERAGEYVPPEGLES